MLALTVDLTLKPKRCTVLLEIILKYHEFNSDRILLFVARVITCASERSAHVRQLESSVPTNAHAGLGGTRARIR